MQSNLDKWFNAHCLLYRCVTQFLCEVHTTEVWTTHRAEMRLLGWSGWQSLVMIGPRRLGIKRKVKLILPAKLEACLGKRIITHLGTGMSLGQIGGMSRDLVSNYPIFYIVFIRQAQMLLRCDI